MTRHRKLRVVQRLEFLLHSQTIRNMHDEGLDTLILLHQARRALAEHGL